VDNRRLGFWSGFSAWMLLEALIWTLALFGVGLGKSLDYPWGWNIGMGVVMVFAIVVGLRLLGGRRRDGVAACAGGGGSAGVRDLL